MGAMPFWSAQDKQCLTITRTLAPRVASWSKTSPELLEGSLGGAKVTRGIATWSNACSQPGRLSLLRLLALSTQLLYNVPLTEGGDAGQLVSHPRYCRRKNLIPGFHWPRLRQWLTFKDGGLFSQVISRSWMIVFLRLGVLRATTYRDQKPPSLKVGAKSEPPRLISIL